jgi:outer membrane murein-binding lipoprotein Lpp
VSDNVENIILEHLLHIRSRVDQISDDMSDLKHRMSSLESAMVLTKHEIAHSDETDARQQMTLDKIIDRIQRIERRLELNN